MNGLRSLKKAVLVALCGGAFAVAGSICPAGSGANPFPHSPDSAATGCNAVITIAVGGAISVAVTDATPYENSEDVLVGVKNNSGTAISSLNITSTTGAFGFDGDGICTYTFVGSSYCTASQIAGTDPGDYAGPGVTFTNISGNLNSGTVNFGPAVAANGGTGYFSLEGLPSASLVITSGGGGGTPAPPSLVLLLAALACMGLYFAFRKPVTN
jgi:hypothetical protein